MTLVARAALAGALLAALAGCADRTVTASADSPRRGTVDTPEDAPAVELSGTAWRLVAIERDGETSDTSSAQVPAIVTFDGDAVEVYDGVNTASGTYSSDGDAVAVDIHARSEFDYPSKREPQHELIELLPRTEEASVDGERLTLELEGGTVLRFELSVGAVPGG